MDSSTDGDDEFIPRAYQIHLEETVIEKNTIIHLPTGSGKTFIAISVINRLKNDLRKPWGQGGKRTFFLVNTIPLVDQQKKVIERLIHVGGVVGYSGEDGVDYWDKKKWNAELTKYQVIVMTSQILADMITHSYIKIEDINLIIFDECHHAVVDHPMRLIMKNFENCPVEDQPRVLGLTATLLNANVTEYKIEEALHDLETTFHATIATVNELGEVLNYSTNPIEVVETYGKQIPTIAAQQAIAILLDLQGLVLSVILPKVAGNPHIKLEMGQHDITRDPKKIVKEVRNMIESMISLINELGVYGGALGVLAYIILLERLKRKAATTEEENLYKFSITHSLHARMILLHSMENDNGYEKIIKHSSPKLILLLNILKEYNPVAIKSTKGTLLKYNVARKDLSAIIFTQQRFTAKVLYNLLKEVKEANPEDFGFLEHDYIVGFNINPFKNTREQYYMKKSSHKALMRFSNKELNCIISTSVIEEGVDIPQCRLVLRYDPPMEYRSYIQSKGRARSAYSTYVMMISADKADKFKKVYQSFQKMEAYIQAKLVGTTDGRDAPSLQTIQRDLYDEDEIPPYISEQGARLSAVSAISLLNRYCSVLPHDQFTIITPMWVQEKVYHPKRGELRLIKIYMPIACPIKDVISGIPIKNLKAAKRSAALNACIRLHQEGELDEITLLPRRYGTVDFERPDVRSCFPNWPWDDDDHCSTKGVAYPGTKRRMRKHERVSSSCLEGSTDWSSGQQNFHLHVIKMKTAFQEPADPREKALYKLLKKNEGFGFLTSKPLPKLCDFPMFLTVGEVTTSLEVNYAVIALDTAQFNLVKEFHYFVFDQVLQVAKKFVVFDGTRNCMYAVPVKECDGYDIDWDVMIVHKHIAPVVPLTAPERKSLKVTSKTYQHHIVSPWYRGNILPDRYIVSNVLEYMTPMSLFDSANDPCSTFADYYSNKYNLKLAGKKDQPLLEVRNISSRMNCLMPRAATIKTLTEKQQKLVSQAQGDDKSKAFLEVFIPEFCVKYDFPGVLWYKAMVLPSIIHRVYMLLVAYELRAEISRQTGIGRPHLLRGEEWLPIEINLHITRKSMLSQIEDTIPVNSVDRINNPIDDNTPRPNKLLSVKNNLYEMQKKKLNQEYPWEEKCEPLDIERNLSTVTVMDIECYDEFVSAPMTVPKETESNVQSPPRTKAAAILPPPLKYVNKINILSKQPDQRGPELKDILAALTTINSHDNFNLERAETLGDSFLKFAVSLYLYHKFPKSNEGQLTNIKCRLIGNRNLFYAGLKKKIAGRMKVEQFSPRNDFMVPGFFAPMEVQQFCEKNQIRPTFLINLQYSDTEILTGQLTDESIAAIQQMYEKNESSTEKEPIGGAQNIMQGYVRSQAVSDKSVADCVEALVGTYLISGGIPAAVKVVEWFNILPPQDNFARLLHKDVTTVLKEKLTTADEVNRVLNHCKEDIEEVLGYTFKDPSLLLEALSHSSYIRNRFTRSYERLEFLGDAILDFLITAHIYENCPDLKPGELTDLRSALVNNVTFASYVVKLGLQKFLCYQLNPVLQKAIINFIEHQERRDHEIVEDVLYLIEEEECMLAEYVEVPKVLSDIFESLAGAIYLDSGGDLDAVWSVYYRIMWREIDAFSKRIPLQPVRVLYEMIHACPVFEYGVLTKSEVPRVMVAVTVTKDGCQTKVFGFGGNKFQAKRAAAKLAIKVLTL